MRRPPTPEFRAKIMGFVRGLDLKDLGTLTALANDSRPDLSGEIIRFIAASRDPKAPQYLAAFLGFQHRGIKLEAIHALGRFEDAMANKILAGFLNDPDEELRVQAALRLKYLGDKPRLLAIIAEASSRRRSGRGATRKSRPSSTSSGGPGPMRPSAFLKGTLERRALFPSAAEIATRLCAVRGLEHMATPAALDALRRGSRARPKKVREACARGPGPAGLGARSRQEPGAMMSPDERPAESAAAGARPQGRQGAPEDGGRPAHQVPHRLQDRQALRAEQRDAPGAVPADVRSPLRRHRDREARRPSRSARGRSS